jgi:hypothetical protein
MVNRLPAERINPQPFTFRAAKSARSVEARASGGESPETASLARGLGTRKSPKKIKRAAEPLDSTAFLFYAATAAGIVAAFLS